MVRLSLLAACAIAAHGATLPSPESLLITNLPGLDPSSSAPEMYSGQIPVGDGDHKIFFWFVRAPRDSPSTPLSFWFTGGPGCSSMAALLSEQGPFWPNPNGTLGGDTASWANLMNMVWVDSPAGVGFSTFDTPYIPDDTRTANDAYLFIKSFLIIFPGLKSRPVYITGESYAGHYVPNLVVRILQGNQEVSESGAGQPVVNLAGFLVGNPWTVPSIDNKGAVDFWSTHGIISAALHDGIVASCDFSSIGPLLADEGKAREAAALALANASAQARTRRAARAIGLVAAAAADPAACQNLVNQAMENFQFINIYDVYADICVGKAIIPPLLAAAATPAFAALHGGPNTSARSSHAPHNSADALKRFLFGPRNQQPDPACGVYFVNDYLNTPAVQRAIHAPSIRWHTCSNYIGDNYAQSSVLSSVIPKYNYVLNYMQQNPNFKFLVYSGDVDGILPFIGTRRWVEQLGATSQQNSGTTVWMADNQTAGWVKSWANGNFVFTTVRGAGHMVPGTQPFRGYEMVRRFLDGSLINGN